MLYQTNLNNWKFCSGTLHLSTDSSSIWQRSDAACANRTWTYGTLCCYCEGRAYLHVCVVLRVYIGKSGVIQTSMTSAKAKGYKIIKLGSNGYALSPSVSMPFGMHVSAKMCVWPCCSSVMLVATWQTGSCQKRGFHLYSWTQSLFSFWGWSSGKKDLS